ncbi:MAG: BMP family ABC transporter substrate-binding protein [Lachnospiraceae bacterium]|nr:BMP family ABC transporter substrate-binding protein [Lachnospiraceae bacterium]
MIKKLISKFFVITMLVTIMFDITACGLYKMGHKTPEQNNPEATEEPAQSIKMGIILSGDGGGGESYIHIDGLYQAVDDLGGDAAQLVWNYYVKEEECSAKVNELVSAGCNIIVADHKMYESYIQQAADAFKDVMFVVVSGDTANQANLPNFKNADTNVFEARYVAGVVAGMKLSELHKAGELPDKAYNKKGNIKVGYVGTFPDEECVSGYNSFFLGIRSIMDNVVMDVMYTNSQSAPEAESEAAKKLIDDGCVFIGQHTYSPAVSSAVQEAYEEGNVCYTIGYGRDMLKSAPDAMLTCIKNNWSVYYKYVIESMINETDVDADWAKGFKDNALGFTEFGPSCAEGTTEQVGAVIDSIKNGQLNISDIDKKIDRITELN